jgi:hypothetical protein
VLTRLEIDGNTRGHKGFRQVRASVMIITIRPVFWYIMIYWVQDPFYPSFYTPRGVGFIRKIRVSYNLSNYDSISICLFYNIYLLSTF